MRPDNGQFEMIQLPYGQDALSPVISEETIAYHYGKHLQAYVNNLNALLPGSGFEDKTLEYIVCHSEGAAFNNAGQILNHNMYFSQFRSPQVNNVPTGKIAELIDRQFGSFEAFKAEFEKKGTTLFGSGWVWLSADLEGQLYITQEINAGNPVTKGLTPLLTFDVWEHAYYLDYQNQRPAHLATLWQIINWDVVNDRIE